MTIMDWKAMWHILSGVIAAWVLLKLALTTGLALWERRLWKQYRKSGVMAVLLCSLSYGCAYKASYVPMMLVPVDASDVYARTVCTTENTIAIILYNHIPQAEVKYVIAHEKEHVRQVREYGDCLGFMKEYADSRPLQLVLEAEAECVAFDMRVADGYDRSLAEAKIVAIFHYLFQEFSEADIVEALPCVPYSPTRGSEPSVQHSS